MDPIPENPQLERLATLNRAWLVQQMLRGLAHDLRNQLQVLALGVPSDGTPPGPALAPRLERAVESMTRSLDALARFGRTEPDLAREADLAHELRQVASWADWQRNLPARRVEVEAAQRCMVAMAPTVVCQIALNFVIDAKDAAPADDRPIRMITRSDGPGLVTLTLSGAGPGPNVADGSGPEAAQLVDYLVARAGGALSRSPDGALRLTLPGWSVP